MNKNLFVSGLPYSTDQEELANFFRACGKVTSVKILVDRQTGRSRGLGFVEMAKAEEARAAIAKLNGSVLGARRIFVSEARPQERGFNAGKGARASFDGPGFVERRSGKDRRQAPKGRDRAGQWRGKPKRSGGDSRGRGGHSHR